MLGGLKVGKKKLFMHRVSEQAAAEAHTLSTCVCALRAGARLGSLVSAQPAA